ncbi:MAG: nitronate monooxygenase [Thermodesulfobacteriota bacterium]|nr:nitronate monooxygenase [Thermodesulfobacteriota bacterium]
MSKLLDMLGCRYPIIQGPIGAMNNPRLVAAICEAGAFGMLAMGFSNPEEAKSLVDNVKELTNKPFGANLMIMNPANQDILDILADAGVKIVTTSAGSPKRIYPHIHALGMKGIHNVLSLPYSIKAADAGVDGLGVSGLEAGGLRSNNLECTTMILVPLVVDHVDIPVIAAGGIADSRGYRAALALGAQGVQIGTRFLASDESPAPKEWKEAIINCNDGSTTLLPLGNMRMRVIINPKLKEKMDNPDADLTQEYNMMNAPQAWNSGDFDLFPAGSGQVGALIKEIKPVKEIIEEMVSS